MWKGLYFIFYMLLHNVQSVRICSGESSGKQRRVDVEMGNVSGQCTCDIQLTVNDPIGVTLNLRKNQGMDGLCPKFKFVLKNNQILDKTWCGDDDFSVPIDTSESLSIRMIVNGTRNSFKFNISTARGGNLIRIVCHGSPPPPPASPSPSSSTTTTSTATQSPTRTTNNLSASLPSRIYTASLPSPTTILNQVSTDESTQISTNQMMRNNEDSDDVLYLPIILGCSVGGTVVTILVIVIAVCVLLKRRQTPTLSNTCTQNNKHGEMIITDNDLYISSDSIPNNNDTNNMAEMEIIPNDLYQSSDSLAHDLNDSRQHDHVPNTNTEYAVVTKKPKKIPNTDNAIELSTNSYKVKADYENTEKEKDNLKIEIDRIAGPKGDEYTLVNKF